MREKAQKSFVTIFPGYRDFHFWKDPGQIPYRFQKQGFKSTIVFWSDGRPLPENELFSGLERLAGNRLSRKFNTGIIIWLLRHSRGTDILNLFHLNWQSLLFAFVYKTLNPRGFVYIKMDAGRYSGIYEWEGIFNKASLPGDEAAGKVSIRTKIKNALIRNQFVGKVDLWSVEDNFTRQAYESEYSFFRGKLITVYNGHTADIPSPAKVSSFDEKEDIILTVGRLGTYQKGTELLLEAFRLISAGTGYKLHLAGSTEPDFEARIRDFFTANPDLQDRVIFHGNLARQDLFSLYSRSKIFCLPSRYEGMAVVFAEAMYFRNAVVTTPFVSPAGLINEFRLGLTAENAGAESLAEKLNILVNNEGLAREYADNAHNFSSEEFNWDRIVSALNEEITRRRC